MRHTGRVAPEGLDTRPTRRGEGRGLRPRDEVVVESRLDGGLRFRTGDRYLAVEPLGATRPATPPASERPARPRGTARKPAKWAPDHPWRERIRADVRLAVARRNQRAEEAARSNGKPPEADAPRCGRFHAKAGRGKRNDRLGVPSGRGPGQAQRDRVRTPDLRAGQARPSDRRCANHPAREDISTSLYPRTFLFRFDTGPFQWRLRRVAMRCPGRATWEADPELWHYAGPLDGGRLARQYDAFVECATAPGAQVEWLPEREDGLADSHFVFDPSFMTPAGAVLLRPGKALLRPEVALHEALWDPAGRAGDRGRRAAGNHEGGDLIWLDEATLAGAGRSGPTRQGLHSCAPCSGPGE